MTRSPPAPPALDSVRWLNNQPYLLLSLTALFWAGNIVLARYVAGHVPPMTLSCVRWIGAFLMLLPFAWPASEARLAGAARAAAVAGAAVGDRVCHQ
jgi:drug/metabolite transporter (DMT)-like permease